MLRIVLLLSLLTVGSGVALGTGAMVSDFSQKTVEARSASDTKSKILKQARTKLERHFSKGTYRINLKARWIPSRLLQQSPKQILAVQVDGTIRKYTNFTVFYTQRNRRKNVQIQLKVEAERKLPVVTDRLRKGGKIEEGQLVYQWVTISQNSQSYITSKEELVGKTLRRTLLSGQPIKKSYISRDLIIRAGDQVQVFIEREGIQIQVSAEARENGAKGDRISVYSNETRKKYEGEVLRPGVIQWKSTL